MPELEIWLCPVHASLDELGKINPLDNCVACLRAERNELKAALRKIVDWPFNIQGDCVADARAFALAAIGGYYAAQNIQEEPPNAR